MEQTDPPLLVASNDQLGPNALAYARARVSLLGQGKHMETVNRALDALEGLPGAALLGGWTFKGFTAWAQGLEQQVALLRANIDSSPCSDEVVARDMYRLPPAHGVFCCAENPNALTVVFKRRPTDDELRNLHELVRAFGA